MGEALDYNEEDLNRDPKTQAMGFVGGHSEMTWLLRLKQMLEKPGLTTNPEERSVASVYFFRDDSEIPILENVDLAQRPTSTVADQLVNCFFQVVHPLFPIVGKLIFMKQYESFYSAISVRPGRKWLAILNLVFAISAKYLRQVQMQTDQKDTTDDSLLYFSRAWKLSMRNTVLMEHPNLQQVQVEGLTAFYLMSVGQINWFV